VNEIVGYGLPPHPTLISETCFKIAVRNSTVKINHNLPVSPENKMTMKADDNSSSLQGFFIENSETYFNNTHFNSVRDIRLIGGVTIISDSVIEHGGHIRTELNNRLHITDTSYLNNHRGIFITDGSYISADRLTIEGVLNTGGLYLDRTSILNNHITDSVIQSNFGTGIDLYQSYLLINNTVVQDNNVGLHNISYLRSFVIDASQITNNHLVEVFATYNSFFHFWECWLTGNVPTVENSINNRSTLLWVFESDPPSKMIPGQVTIHDISIDTSIRSRFIPSLSSFYIINNVRSSDPEITLLNEIKSHIIAKEPENAIEKVLMLIEYHPETDQARQAMAYLPMLTNAVEGCVEELIIFLSEIDHEDLIHSAMLTKALTRMFNRDFYDAIHDFETVINEYPCEIVQAISIIDQAYSYYRLYESGARNLPAVSRNKPKTREEYLEIREEIMAQLLKGVIKEPEPTETVPEVFVFSTRNFPNPFNPETTIQFSIGNVENVIINVYNVRGQRVRTLLDGSTEFEAGYHYVVWNGRDDSGRQVGSGVYFYRLVAGENTAVRRMLLLR